jgi:protein ImuB
MGARYVSIWFPHLTTDWFSLRQPQLRNVPFVLRAPSHGRMIITATNAVAEKKGLSTGMALADARAAVPDLEALDDKPDLIRKLLKRLAEWCIRFTPVAAVDPPDGLMLDASGCTHLWGGDEAYVGDIVKKLNGRGYNVRIAIADTIGVAWGVARFGKPPLVSPDGQHIEALMALPPEALRLETEVIERLHKLGLRKVRQLIDMPRTSLRRRFGQHFLMRLDMALGQEMEVLQPVEPIEPYQERLPCLEPIRTAPGIEIALRKLLETLCTRLQQEQKGLRKAIFKGYRIDGKVEQVEIGTNGPSNHVNHIFKLFETKLPNIEPALGIELFTIEAPKVEDHRPKAVRIWEGSGNLEDTRLSELIDRLVSKAGTGAIHRYLPDEHHWPERSYRPAASLGEKPATAWPADKLRPVRLLKRPEPIEVTAPIPDYPPMLFRYHGKLHQIVKADGPERLEQEWWIQQGQHRDYYRVEDESGHRYWLFRSGHYHDQNFQWFLHGFFA